MSDGLQAEFERRFPSGTVVAAQLRQPSSEFSLTVLFGPSGCGKTTVLRCLAGLDRPQAGTIRYNDLVWFDARQKVCLPPQRRDIGFGFQDYALFPHLTIAENIGYGLRGDRAARDQAVAQMLERFELSGLGTRYPHQISGGQQQRVALARVLVRRPRLLLLDEPLSALDSQLREAVRSQLRRLLGEFAIPVVLVTHDRTEAIALADRIVVMRQGRVAQEGSVEEVFSRPVDSEIARIVGVETIETGEIVGIREGLATVVVRGLEVVAVAPSEPAHRVHVCIKGEDVTLQREVVGAQSSRNHWPANVMWISPEGPLLRVGLDCGMQLTSLITRAARDELQIEPGDRVVAVVKASAIHLISVS